MERSMPLSGLRVAAHTLGCKLNFAETSSLVDALCSKGARRAAEGERADIAIVGTCSVTDVADQKCRQAIHRMVRRHPGAFLVVVGCYAQLAAEQLSRIEGVSLVVGMEQKAQAAELICNGLGGKAAAVATGTWKEIRTFVPSCSRGDRTRYFLKVQDGCDYFCTYCTIPLARGRSRNATIGSLVAQARRVAESGGREIILTGVNIGDFGKSTGETFFDLVKALDRVEGIERYRISSIEPNLLTTEIIDYCARSPRFMPHFHVPLQSGSDEVLRLMHRRYDTASFERKIAAIKEKIPHAFVGVDIIVGTRGETDELFAESLAFCASLPVAQYHVFSYSEREGTAALRIPYIVDGQTKHMRSRRMIELSEQKHRLFCSAFIGEVRPVLVEHYEPGEAAYGFTDNYIRVEIEADRAPAPNTVVPVRLDGFAGDGKTVCATPV